MRAIYIHIPFCRSRCHYCTFTSNCDYTYVDSYIDALCNNMVYDDQLIDTVFIGGGTPSTLTTTQLDKIFASLHSHHNISHYAEITVECNPDSITQPLVQCLVRNGVNRVSIGLQSVNDDTLSIIGRRHTYADFVTALQLVHDGGIDNINVDIMIGLPESHQQFIHTVNTVSKLDITHISMYALELYPDSVLYDMVNSGQCSAVCSEDSQAELYDIAMNILRNNSFDRYEISNFAKKGMQCRHNLHYWQCHQYHGYGLSAHGYIDDVRYANTCQLASYIEGDTINNRQLLTVEDKMYEYVMLALRLDEGLSMSDFYKTFGMQVTNVYGNIVNLVGSGQLIIDCDRLYVAPQYTYVLTAILAEIL